MRGRFIVSFCLALIACPAHAAIWSWGCQGQLGDRQIVFDRDALYVLKAGTVKKVPAKFTPASLDDAVAAAKQDKEPIATYQALSGGGGFERAMEFIRSEQDQRKAVFLEKSSKRNSHKHRLVCGRDEDTEITRKVYSYRREDEPARDITMQCVEYQLSTRGGRKGCE
ncbi:MAG: hypothetical protein ACR2K5_08180 [Pseudolabrys sp.]